MTSQTPTPARVSIERIAAGGEGVGRLPDGRAVFVHRTAPGDVADVRITMEKRRWARAELVTLHEMSALRREPACRYYARCGGCTLEHLVPEAQRHAKAELVASALARIGGTPLPAPEVVPSPSEFDYRNRATFTLVRTPGAVRAGFHELGRPGRVVDLDGACRLLEPALAAVWNALRVGWGPDAALLPGGSRLRLTLRTSLAGEATLLVEGGSGRGRPEALLQAVPGLRAVWRRPAPGAPARLAAGEGFLRERWGEEDIDLRGDAFLQVNRGAAARLEAHVLECAGDVRGLRIIDAYCGVGLHARRLARAGAHVTGIELDRHAVAEASRAAPGARFVHGRVEDLLAAELPADLVIVNPPRTGMAPTACEALRARPPGRLLYVSCDPATLARDVARLAPALAPTRSRGFDLFPQTAHVETVLEMTCATS